MNLPVRCATGLSGARMQSVISADTLFVRRDNQGSKRVGRTTVGGLSGSQASEHGFDPSSPGCEVDVLRSRMRDQRERDILAA